VFSIKRTEETNEELLAKITQCSCTPLAFFFFWTFKRLQICQGSLCKDFLIPHISKTNNSTLKARGYLEVKCTNFGSLSYVTVRYAAVSLLPLSKTTFHNPPPRFSNVRQSSYYFLPICTSAHDLSSSTSPPPYSACAFSSEVVRIGAWGGTNLMPPMFSQKMQLQ
jgi:hypothetical protein